MGKPIVIAAANSLPADKACADAVCTGARDELVLSGQIALLTRGGTLLLLDGDYYIDGFPFEDNTAVYFGSGYLKLTGVFAESFFNDRYLHKKPRLPQRDVSASAPPTVRTTVWPPSDLTPCTQEESIPASASWAWITSS